MFRLYETKFPNQLFPRNEIDYFTNLHQLKKNLISEYRFLSHEIQNLKKGQIVRNHYCIELCPLWLKNVALEGLGWLSPDELAILLNTSFHEVEKELSDIVRTMKRYNKYVARMFKKGHIDMVDRCEEVPVNASSEENAMEIARAYANDLQRTEEIGDIIIWTMEKWFDWGLQERDYEEYDELP